MGLRGFAGGGREAVKLPSSSWGSHRTTPYANGAEIISRFANAQFGDAIEMVRSALHFLFTITGRALTNGLQSGPDESADLAAAH
jgi:hypothetical protein